jgi:hypothetical protein
VLLAVASQTSLMLCIWPASGGWCPARRCEKRPCGARLPVCHTPESVSTENDREARRIPASRQIHSGGIPCRARRVPEFELRLDRRAIHIASKSADCITRQEPVRPDTAGINPAARWDKCDIEPSDHNILCLPVAATPKTHKIVFSFGRRAARRL